MKGSKENQEEREKKRGKSVPVGWGQKGLQSLKAAVQQELGAGGA